MIFGIEVEKIVELDKINLKEVGLKLIRSKETQS